ncbi:MAG: glycerol-3-phosphate 1-O-acyltransferase PlsY [Acidobacteriota bacterium]|nr:glycerol-3-phosphate 1-O-acyltransferase PlsY [Thermoanaerobaculaceae bacterium]
MTKNEILIAILAYFLGAIPFGYIIAKLRSGEDIRKKGSGNIGATNVLRTQGAFYGFLTLFLDAAKAALPVYFARHYGTEAWFPALAGGVAIIGHCYPVYIGFKGGKGAASGLGAFLFIAPIATLIACGSFLIVMFSFGYVSVGSMVGSFVFVSVLWAFHFFKKSYDLYTCIIATLLAILLVYRHRSNIKNLFEGKEKKIWEKDEKQ